MVSDYDYVCLQIARLQCNILTRRVAQQPAVRRSTDVRLHRRLPLRQHLVEADVSLRAFSKTFSLHGHNRTMGTVRSRRRSGRRGCRSDKCVRAETSWLMMAGQGESMWARRPSRSRRQRQRQRHRQRQRQSPEHAWLWVHLEAETETAWGLGSAATGNWAMGRDTRYWAWALRTDSGPTTASGIKVN